MPTREAAFGRATLLSGLVALAVWAGVMALASLFASASEDAAGNGWSILLDQGLIHLVLLPAFFFAAFACLQIAGYLAEKNMMLRGDSRLRRRWLIASGRMTLSHGAQGISPQSYLEAQKRTDALLFRPLDFGVGALTMLGLLGTIIGLSFALGDLPAVLEANADSSAKTEVLGSLGFAFLTTIIGIVGSLCLSLAKLYLLNIADRARFVVEEAGPKTTTRQSR